jgi:antitoxin (DNA-binding transcriptional repressor) of toxin-antitoxin stability system
MAEGKKTGGRVAGTPNKATNEARQAIASFVDGNAHRLTEWLDQVANGVKVLEITDDGEPIEKYVVPPNPAKAFDMFQSVVEYHIPKLARMEHSGSDTNPVVIEHNVNVFGELLKSIKMSRQADK